LQNKKIRSDEHRVRNKGISLQRKRNKKGGVNEMPIEFDDLSDDDFEPDYDEPDYDDYNSWENEEGWGSYDKYGGPNGWDDFTIDAAFEGDPDAVWNID